MANNIFAPQPSAQDAPQEQSPAAVRRLRAPDYTHTPATLVDHIISFAIGFAAGFAVLFIFYKIIILSIIGGLVVGFVNIFMAGDGKRRKRLVKLRTQFYDLLEAMSVSMRAGNPALKALQSAREDLVLIYQENSDIIVEIDLILSKFNNSVPLSQSFTDFAERCGLEDVKSFASIYATIEGKSSRADEIVRETQQIIADKMEIEMEIETLMTSAKSEANIMLFLPLVILLVIGYAGAGFMDAIYTTPAGRAVATGGLIIFVISFLLSKKFSNIKI